MMIELFTAALLQIADIKPVAETDPVATLEDAADDPAIWFNDDEPEQTRILGTDKTAGLRVYDLQGREVDFAPVGRLNNVDVIKGVQLTDWSGDLAAATNRTDDSVVLFSVDAAGVEEIGRFSVAPEPYGFCMAASGDGPILFVAHKQGYVQPYVLVALGEPPRALPPLYVRTQIEGCVAYGSMLYVGEEERGVWRAAFDASRGFAGAEPLLIDEAGGANGLVADVEGLTVYARKEDSFLIASSQGDDGFLVYDVREDHAFRGKFRIVANAEAGVDGAQETDGIDVFAGALGAAYPGGVLIVQDGFNVAPGVEGDGRTPEDENGDAEPRAPQNFKIVRWADVVEALGLDR